MKKLIALLTIVSVLPAFSQGTVNFQNRNTATTPAINAPISYDINVVSGPIANPYTVVTKANGAGTGVMAGGFDYGGVNAQAGLYGAPAGASVDQMVLLVPSVGFRTGAAAGYVNVGSTAARAIASVVPGADAVVQIRAWDAGVAGIASYEAAKALVAANHGVFLGASTPMTVTTGGAGSPPGPAADLIGLAAFNMTFTVPEPSIIGLGILGGLAGLMVFRRRN